MARGELTGQLYFSDDWPETFIGQLGPYEITGHRVSKIRADIKARRRDGKPVQGDFFDERAAEIEGEGAEGASEASGGSDANDGVETGAVHEGKRV